MASLLEQTPPSPAAVPSEPRDWGRLSPTAIAHLAARVHCLEPKRKPVEVFSPIDGALLGTTPRATAFDVDDAVGRARRVQEEWSQRPFRERAAPLLRFHDLLLDRQEEILDLLQLETGKARKHAFEEVADAAIVARHYAFAGEELLEPKRRRGALPGITTAWEYRHAKGVVGLIAPWNYPLSLSVSDAIPALLAGNAVVVKPDRQTPFTALWAFALLEEAGLPHGLVEVVTGEGSALGPALVESCDYLSFTGSTATGKKLAALAGDQLIGCSLELGGKNPLLVLADADLEEAVAGAIRGSFSNAGQLCISFERIYVHESLYPRFLYRFASETRALRLGCDLDYSADMGSLASASQLAKCQEHVTDALAKGARLEAGGRARPDLGPCFFEPTVLTGVDSEMRVFAEETFGPVVAVYPFESVHDAIERANATRYGLNAAIYTRDLELGRRIATRIKAGTVNVNEAYAAAWASVDAPMGGMKDSGLGRRHGAEGLLKFTEAQTVAIQRLLPIAAPAGVADQVFSRAMSETLKLLKRLPGLR